VTKPLGTLQHYLYSTPHLAGCAGAIGALALFFTGLIGPGWVVIVMGAYAAGALIGKSLAGEPTVVAHLDEEDVMRELVALENRARDLLPAQARQTLSAIVEKAAALLPELERLQAKGALSAAVRQDVIAGLTRYLPDTLNSYLALPAVYLKTHQSGRANPADMLVEQLKLVDDHLGNSLKSVFDEQAESLAINGRFLADKLAATGGR